MTLLLEDFAFVLKAQDQADEQTLRRCSEAGGKAAMGTERERRRRGWILLGYKIGIRRHQSDVRSVRNAQK